MSQTIATLLACLLAVFLSATPVFLFFLIRKYRGGLFSPIATKESVAWAPVASNIRLDLTVAQYFLPVSYLQRFLYGAFLVLVEQRYLLCVFLVFPPALITAFVVFARPLRVPAMRILHVLSEAETLCAYICICVLTFGYSDPQEIVGWLVVSLAVKSLCCLLGITLIGVFLRIRGWLARRKNAVVSPSAKLPEFEETALAESSTDAGVESMKPRFYEKALDADRKTRLQAAHYSTVLTTSQLSPSSGGRLFKYI